MTLAAIKAHRDGIVTACSISACGAAFDDAVARLRDCPTIDTGVHLTLVEERPLLPASRVASLAGSNGRFLPGFKQFVARYARRAVNMTEVESELRAQIERILGAGLTLVHANGHQHLHLLPRIFDVVLRLAGEYKIGYVRTVQDLGRADSFLRAFALGQLNRFGEAARRKSREAGVVTNDFTIGIAEAGDASAERLVALISRAEGITEIVAHPGLDDDELSKAYDWGYAWEQETAALCSAQVRSALSSVRLTSIRELLSGGRATVEDGLSSPS